MRKLWADPEYRAKQMASRRKKGIRRQHMTDPLPARTLEKRGGLVSDDETERLYQNFRRVVGQITKARETAQARADDLQALADRQRREIAELRARAERAEEIIGVAYAAVVAWAKADELTDFDAEMTALDVAIADDITIFGALAAAQERQP